MMRHVLMMLSVVVLAWPAAAHGQGALPKSVTLGTNPPGTVFYTVASGLAKAVSGVATFEVALQPYTGTSTFLPLLNGGEVEFGVVNAVDMGLAYRGSSFKIGGRNPFPHAPNSRLVLRGAALMVGLLARQAWSIQSVYGVTG